MSKLITALSLSLLAGVAIGAPNVPVKAALPSKYTVRVKMVDKKGKATLVPIAEILRTNGVVTTKTVPGPALAALSTQFAADWAAYKQPASVKVTESHPDHTGMHPQYHDYTFTFTAKDKLYKAAVIRDFLAKHGYEGLGMRTIDFVLYDRSAEYPPNADDRASTLSNFRKGDKLEYNNGAYSVFVSKRIRPTTSPGEGRKSASEPTISLAVGYDEGLFDVGYMLIYEDGRIELKTKPAEDVFKSHFGTFDTKEDIEVNSILPTEYHTWKTWKVDKTSPMLLEAYIIQQLEYRHPYDVTPVIDFMTVK